MKVANLKEDRLIAHTAAQLHKLEYYDTTGKTLYQLTSTLARVRRIRAFEEIDHNNPANEWFQ